MVHLVATIANDAELMPAMLFSLRGQVNVPDVTYPNEAWGVGYFADDRGLIVRKPGASLEDRSDFGVAGTLKSRIIVSCAREARISSEAPPYRFRQWLFGYCGDLKPFGQLQPKVLSKLPDFVHDVLGQNHGGRLVHGMFLTELHRAGLLEDILATPAALGGALERTAEMLHRLGPEAGVETVNASFVASNGRILIVSCAGLPLWIRRVDGLERMPEGPVDETLHNFKRVIEALRRFRAYAVALNVAPDMHDWRKLPERGSIVFDSSLQLHELSNGG